MVHPDITMALARQHIDEARRHADEHRRRPARRSTPARLRLGRLLVRWGARLGATTTTTTTTTTRTGASARALSAATMTT